ncbi:MAG: hypothetical protein GTO53_13945 [Planctomycetales bacterium]|nr:hypothetical protein [Planctomycetales bacterium]NIN09612.1 hypothetical protein [Planctomycetales bacterium]NIN78736.1 hypothetical protein [Planctomycetales bacterium]NIO35910.1 hypothetical protein [Planctomycetales bacterium]NIO47668.1 hypothetical protein [Planctomycetales bacterium]
MSRNNKIGGFHAEEAGPTAQPAGRKAEPVNFSKVPPLRLPIHLSKSLSG